MKFVSLFLNTGPAEVTISDGFGSGSGWETATRPGPDSLPEPEVSGSGFPTKSGPGYPDFSYITENKIFNAYNW